MLPLLIFDAFYFHDEWGPNELSHTTESETGLIPVKYKCHRNICSIQGPIHNYVDKMRGGRGQKMSVFVHAQSVKTVHAGGWGQRMANFVHVVIKCPLTVFGSIFGPWLL